MEDNNHDYYQFDLLKPESGIDHIVFSRKGGSSKAPFDLLNVGLNSGDENDSVQNNRKLVAQKMKMRPLIYLNQVHGDDIQIIKKDDNDLARVFEPGKDLYTADAVISDMDGIYLVIQVADCQSVMMYDSKRQVAANVHSGWRGSIKNIVGQCVDKMVAEFGTNPENIIACISPSLGPCCAEFINYKDEIPYNLWGYKIEGSNNFDFWKLSFDQLLEKGLKKNNIENMNICTKCNSQEFFSYRKEKVTGRFACVIGLNG